MTSTTPIYEDYSQFFEYWQNRSDYITLSNLQHFSCYRVFARNAVVAVWDAHNQAFLIARFKLGPAPYLFHELHWDSCTEYGTVKPVEKLCDCPLELQTEDEPTANEEQLLLEFLLATERRFPLIPGRDSVDEKQTSAVRFLQHLKRTNTAN